LRVLGGRKGRGAAYALPEGEADKGGEGKEDAEGDGEGPDGFDLVAGGLIDGDEGEVGEGLWDGGGGGTEREGRLVRREGSGGFGGEEGTVEERKGLAEEGGDDDGGDEEEGVEDGGKEEG